MNRTCWTLSCAAALLLGGWAADNLPADKKAKNDDVTDRRRLTPGLVLNTNGRQGPCDVLAFVPNTSDNGYCLMAAGDDKVVRFWKVNGDLDSQDMKLLRWPIFREQRGAIHAAALSPYGGKQIVVAGYGIFNSYLAVLDRATGHVEHSVSAPPNKALFAVTFAPDGKHVAYGADDGSVWLWDLHANDKDNVRPLLKGDPDRPTNRAYVVAFLDDSRLLAVTQDGKVREVDVRQPMKARLAGHFQSSNLFKVALSPDQRWLAAATYEPTKHLAEVELLSLDGQGQQSIPAPRRDCVPTCLAWDAKNTRLAVGMQQMQLGAAFPKVQGGRIYVYDMQRLAAPVVEMDRDYYPEALAFHPDKTHLLASAGGANHEVYLWDLQKPAKPVSTIRGPGSSLWGVGLSADNRYLSFQEARNVNPKTVNERGTGPWRVFDLQQRHFVTPRGTDFKSVLPPLESAGGWHVAPDPKDGFRWFVQHGEDRWALDGSLYNKAINDIPRCYTFIKAQENQAVRLAVGHYWGISVYALDIQNGPRLVRRMDGHEGEVMALAPSADGKNLVSASRDQTIAGWTLEGWDQQHELGASFKANGHLIVDKVDLFSPAWEVGLAPEDKIELLLLPKGEYYKDPDCPLDRTRPTLHDGNPIVNSAVQKPVSLDAALRYLKNPSPDRSIIFQWRTPDKRVKAALTTVRQRPLWKFFPTRTGEWVLFRWRDYFYDCSPHGDQYFGWHENANPKAKEQTPHFYPLERYRDRFHRPEKISEGLRAFVTDPKKAFTEAFAQIEAPEVSIKVDNPKPNNQDVTVTITVKPRSNDKGQQLDRVILWRDDYRVPLEDPPNKVYTEFKKTISKEELHRGINRFKLVAYNEALGRGEQTVTVNFTPDPNRPQKGHLYAVCVGINNYNKLKGLVADPLTSCVNDAKTIKGMLVEQKAMYVVEEPKLLLDGDATAANILKAIAAVKKAHPDDLFVLSLSGHGFAREIKTDRGPKLYDPKSWFFACTNTDNADNARDTRLDSAALYEALAKLKCHKLVLLDACHAGSAVKQCDPARAISRDGMPLTLFAACQVHEAALEIPGKNGLFTLSLVSAVRDGTPFNKTDKNILDARELAAHLKDDVPRRRKKANGEEQMPVCFPEQPDPIPLFRILHEAERR